MRAAGIAKIITLILVSTAALTPLRAAAEIEGDCSRAVGTFLTKNKLDNNGREGASRSLLVLTNGGHALRFDSDETSAAMDTRPFGSSAGTWRCDGVADDGTVRVTVTTLDFTYADAEGEPGQIARIDATGTYAPGTETMTLSAALAFLPMTSDAQSADALSTAPSKILIEIVGQRVDLPAAP